MSRSFLEIFKLIGKCLYSQIDEETTIDWILFTSESIDLVYQKFVLFYKSFYQKILGILQWIAQAWFILVPLIFASIHLLISFICTKDLSFFHQLVALVLKLIGGFLVLWSINSKNGTMLDKSLFDLFMDWIYACPLKSNSLVVQFQAEPATGSATVSNAEFRNSGNAETIEEKLEYLQKQINYLKKDLNKEVLQVRSQIAMNSKKIDTVVLQTQSSLNSVSKQLQSVSIGGLGRQIFGANLVIYGAIVSFLISGSVGE